MIMMAVAHLLVAGAAFAEVVALDDAGVLEQLHGAIDCGDRDLVVDRDTAPVQFFDVRMIGVFSEDPGNDPALLGHPHAGGGTTGLDPGGIERWRGFQGGHHVSPYGCAFCHPAQFTTSPAASEAHSTVPLRAERN